MRKGRNPIKDVVSSRLSLWATGAPLNWGLLGDSEQHAAELSPRQAQPQEMRKLGHLFSSPYQSLVYGCFLRPHKVPLGFFKEELVPQLLGMLSVDIHYQSVQ